MQNLERVAPPLPFGEFSEVIDVRSPTEFAEDHLPGAINLPVLNDAQRAEVGTLHQHHPFEARRLGAALVTANIHRHLRETLADKPRDYAPLVYCWRGNMRSQSLTTIMRAIGWRARLLDGGFKAWRRWLIDDLERLSGRPSLKFIVLAGLTGCAKTRLLGTLAEKGEQVLDLEKLANHKGSILGSPYQDEQPTQKTFERRLWETLHSFSLERPVFTEAESNRIGRLQVPAGLWQKFRSGRVIKISMALSARARFLAQDYPYFMTDSAALKDKLDGLRRLRGHEQVDRWHRQIDDENWPAFLESILLDHYDLVYRRPGSADSIYQKPERSIELTSHSPEQLEEACLILQELASTRGV